MSDILPSELFWGILSRLPIEPLLRFRCVCNEWRQIIDDPTFIRSHLRRRRSGGDRILITASAACRTTKFYTSSLESVCNFEIERTIWAEPISLDVPYIKTRFPLPSCDGLILISPNYDENVWWLWNPCTRESIKLPQYDDDDITRGCSHQCGGLGYDRATDDYKVVRIAQFDDLNNEVYMLETLIYSLKLNCWRRIEDFPSCYIHWRSRHGVFVNGALHWIAYVKRRGQGQEMEWIIALNLGTENYRLLPLPLVLYARNESSLFGYKNLNVMDGCLFMICHSSKHGLEGWMMKDYGGTNSTWTKLFSFAQLREIDSGELRFVACLKNKGEVLIHRSREEFLLLDVEKKSVKRITIGDAPYNLTSQVFPGSLVRLKNNNSCGGGDQKKINSTSCKKSTLFRLFCFS